jgi:hypothetical protein
VKVQFPENLWQRYFGKSQSPCFITWIFNTIPTENGMRKRGLRRQVIADYCTSHTEAVASFLLQNSPLDVFFNICLPMPSPKPMLCNLTVRVLLGTQKTPCYSFAFSLPFPELGGIAVLLPSPVSRPAIPGSSRFEMTSLGPLSSRLLHPLSQP